VHAGVDFANKSESCDEDGQAKLRQLFAISQGLSQTADGFARHI